MEVITCNFVMYMTLYFVDDFSLAKCLTQDVQCKEKMSRRPFLQSLSDRYMPVPN